MAILQKVLVHNQDRESLKALYDKIKERPEELLEVFICNHKPCRTANQRKYYFGVIVTILAEHTGFSREEMNEELKLKFNKKSVQRPDGSWLVYGGSIENEKVSECERIFEEIRLWAFEYMDLVIPLPTKIKNDELITLNLQ
jgi:hypothetical protein